ncbi:MAG TPA: ABC transporter permease subunit [Actinoplanes sp.]
MNALRSEWTKLSTSPGTIWMLLGIVALTAGLSAASAATAGCPAVDGCAVDPARTGLIGVQLGQAVVVVLGALLLGGEYGTGMIAVSLAATPRRTSLLLAKAANLTALVAVSGALGVLGSYWFSRLLLPGRGYHLGALTEPMMLRAVGGSVLYLVLVSLLGLGLAATVREPAAAIGIALGLLYVFPIVTSVVSAKHWKRHLEQIQPMGAGLNIQATVNLHGLVLSPWAGLGVLAAWAFGALIVGWLLLIGRDA